MNEWKEVAIALLSIFGGLMSWYVKSLDERVTGVRNEIFNLATKMVQEYVHEDELAKLESHIETQGRDREQRLGARFDKLEIMVEKIFNKLDSKADRRNANTS